VTFAVRFVIFHYVLFARPKTGERPGQEELPEPLELAGERRADPPRR
jgi:hypothetical protein